jgi:hypothetical protein
VIATIEVISSGLQPFMRSLAPLLCLLSVAAHASSARVAVDFAPPAKEPAWFVDALEQLVGNELARFARTTLVDKLPADACSDRTPACLLERYRSHGVDVVILGALTQQRLDYQIYETWTPAQAIHGSLNTAGISRSRLEQKISELVRPIVQSGGLLDKKPAAVAAAAPRAQPPLSPFFFGALLLLLLCPPLLPVLILRRRFERPRSWKWSGAVIAAVCLGLFADRVDLLGALRPLIAPLAAGILWGWFVLSNLTWVLAPVHGLGRIRHDALWPLLKAWLALTLLRLSLLSVYLPLYFLTALATDDLEGSIVLPAVGLLALFWLHSVADNLATVLDRTLVVGAATARNPWHATIRRYFRGYLRRGGLTLDPTVLEQALFLPSRLPGVVCYGGGFSRPRILVGERTLELALGELPDEPEAPERTVNPEELPWGLVVPEENRPALPPRRWWQRGASAEARRHALTLAAPRPREPKPRLLGENVTALGWVVPLPQDESLPLISSTREDFEVVKSLLSEHYAVFENNLDDDFDDTDPTQKDFLFGALVGAVGSFTRSEGLLSTIRLAVDAGLPRSSWLSRKLIGFAATVRQRFFAFGSAVVGDAYAALNQALHPTIQYLHHLRGGDPSVLTQRADIPKLNQVSRKILEALIAVPPTPDERFGLSAVPRNRLLWLSRFFHTSLAARKSQRLAIGLGVFIALAIAAVAVLDAIDYHPTYVERMSQKAQKATAASPGANHERTANE